MSSVDCGKKKQLYLQNDMSDTSRYLYGRLPPDIMPKGLPNNGNDSTYHRNSFTKECYFVIWGYASV